MNFFESVALLDVCNPKQWPTIAQSEFTESGYPVYGANGVIGFFSEFNHAEPTVLITCRGATCGEVNICSAHSYVTGNSMALDDLDESRVDYRYLARYLRFSGLKKSITGTAQPQITRQGLSSVTLLLPELDEQKRIAAILDQAESLRAKRRAAHEQLDALAQAVFIEMFGDPVSNPHAWPKVPFSELLNKIESGKSPVCLDRPARNGEWGVLKLGAISQCEYRAGESKALENLSAVDERYEVKAGDILFARKNTYELVAACVLVQETPSKLLLPDLIFRFRLREFSGVLPDYLQQLLVYPSKRKDVQKLAGGAAGSMPNISKENLLKYLIEVPPMPLQEKFAERMQHLREQKVLALRQLESFDSLFSSLQHRAFRGEL